MSKIIMDYYKNKAYCPFYHDCNEGWHCKEAMTGLIERRASVAGYPILTHVNKPDCFIPKESE